VVVYSSSKLLKRDLNSARRVGFRLTRVTSSQKSQETPEHTQGDHRQLRFETLHARSRNAARTMAEFPHCEQMKVESNPPSGPAQGSEEEPFRRRNQNCRRRSLGHPRASATWSAQTTRHTPLGSIGAVGTNNSAKRNLPDRAWRFGPTATLSGRGDDTLPVPVARIPKDGRSNQHPQSGSRMRRHRWLQASELPTRVASTEAVGTRNLEIHSGMNVRDHRMKKHGDDRVSWKSPDGPEFLPSPSIARWVQVPIEIFFSLIQRLRRGEVATTDF
jgi:hypothetical protein